MRPKRNGREHGAAFVMEADDRFHRIIISDGVRYEADAAAETVLAFFVIRRASGAFDVVNVNKTFRGEECVSRTVQSKKGIPAGRIAGEVDAIRTGFARGIEEAMGFRLTWRELDLSDVEDRAGQLARIRSGEG